MNAISGLNHIVRDLRVKGTLESGQLQLKVNAGNLNGGTADINLSVNTRVTPSTLKVDAHFDKVGGIPGRDGYPKNGALFLQSRGESPAEIAGNLNGQAFLELGEGPFNYANLTLLSADVATRASRTLLAGVEKSEGRLGGARTRAACKEARGTAKETFAFG